MCVSHNLGFKGYSKVKYRTVELEGNYTEIILSYIYRKDLNNGDDDT